MIQFSNGSGGMSVERKIVNDELHSMINRPKVPSDSV